MPHAESAAIALASLQFGRGEIEAPIALIHKTFERTATFTDPGRLAGYGFYLRWPAIKAAMRAELGK